MTPREVISDPITLIRELQRAGATMPLCRFRLADEQLGDGGGIVDHDENSVRRD